MSFTVAREHPRFPVSMSTAVEISDGHSRACRATNISRGGLMLHMPEHIELYQEIRVSFVLGIESTLFRLPAETRSCRFQGDYYAVGIKFIAMGSENEARLGRVLKSEFERRAARRYAMRTRVEGRVLDQPGKTAYRLQAMAPSAVPPQPETRQLFGRDVSQNGMRLLSDEPFDNGKNLELNLKMRLGHQLMKADSVVRWCKEDDKLKRYEIGVEFTSLDNQSADFLNSLLEYATR